MKPDEKLVVIKGFGCFKRADALKLIYRHTHADYKGKAFAPSWGHANIGKRTIMHAGALHLLDDLSDAAVIELLPYAVRAEIRRQAAKKAKALA